MTEQQRDPSGEQTEPVDVARQSPTPGAAGFPPPTGEPYTHLPAAPHPPAQDAAGAAHAPGAAGTPAAAPGAMPPRGAGQPWASAPAPDPSPWATAPVAFSAWPHAHSADVTAPLPQGAGDPPAGGPPPPTSAAPGPRSSRWSTGTVAVVAAAVLLAALLGGTAGALIATRSSGLTSAGVLPVPQPGSTSRPQGSIAGIAARALPSVVTLKVKGADGQGTGSGFVIKSDGFILTNNHVVSSAAATGSIRVEFSDGSQLPATIVGRDASYDLAVVRVKRTGLPVLPLGSSASVVVGDPVVAVGAPLGLESTVTSGIVSALNRPVTPGGADDAPAFINAIQTDAAINPGNSGGPLLDMSGRVIGVNSAIARIPGSSPLDSGQSGSIGVGFAIPSDQARKTADQLMTTGKASHPVIGVILDTAYEGEGVRIAASSKGGRAPITQGGPADKAGLKAGDVILKFNGRVISDPDQLVVSIRARSVGETVTLTVRRGTTERTVRMTLQAATD
ncbi:MAG: trypsin-like peptidase domain-containing protein [Oryzihumus sp.]